MKEVKVKEVKIIVSPSSTSIRGGGIGSLLH